MNEQNAIGPDARPVTANEIRAVLAVKSRNAGGWTCLECGKKFRTVASAERASSVGCPKCGGVDIDLL